MTPKAACFRRPHRGFTLPCAVTAHTIMTPVRAPGILSPPAVTQMNGSCVTETRVSADKKCAPHANCGFDADKLNKLNNPCEVFVQWRDYAPGIRARVYPVSKPFSSPDAGVPTFGRIVLRVEIDRVRPSLWKHTERDTRY